MTTASGRPGAPHPLPLDDADAWAAVLARDARSDGALVFAVTTTGIYCRPSCPARRPRREHARFFPTPEAAEDAGFRPCRRCRPREHPADAAALAVRLRRVCDAIDARPDGTPSLAALGASVGWSAHQLRRAFVRALGMSPHEYARARRAARLRHHLQEGETVSRATFEAGYGSGSRAYAAAPARLGMTPATYRRGGAGETITWATAASPFGRLLVAASARGVCAVQLGDDDDTLAAALAAEFPAAALTRDDGALAAHLAAVVRALDDAAPAAAIPVDLRGTAFQERVWRALREIPRGETRSYAELAAAIERPGAARAVAAACAANRVALLVPCHRVIRGDGAPGGYRWGAARKRALLEAEGGAAQPRGTVEPTSRGDADPSSTLARSSAISRPRK